MRVVCLIAHFHLHSSSALEPHVRSLDFASFFTWLLMGGSCDDGVRPRLSPSPEAAARIISRLIHLVEESSTRVADRPSLAPLGRVLPLLRRFIGIFSDMYAATLPSNAASRARARFAQIETLTTQNEREVAIVAALREASESVQAATEARSNSRTRAAFEYQNALRTILPSLTELPRTESPPSPPECGLCNASVGVSVLRVCGRAACSASMCVDCLRRLLNTPGPATCETCMEDNPSALFTRTVSPVGRPL